MRDRRFDWLYERQKQPIRDLILERAAARLAEELRAWPPPFVEWVGEAERRRWAAGAAAAPRGPVRALALRLARLDLRRDFEGMDRLLAAEGPATLRDAGEEAAVQLLRLLVTEQCLALKEWADGARLTRDDLVRLVDLAEARLPAP